MSTPHQKFAAKTFAIGAGILIFIVAPVGIYAATTVGKSVGVSSNLNNGLVGWWTFDGANMLSNVADSSGNGKTGFLRSFTSTTTVAGKLGEALQFNGTSNYVTSPNQLIQPSGTVSMWFNSTTIDTSSQSDNNAYLFSYPDVSVDRLYILLVDAALKLRLGGSSQTGTLYTISANKWYHVSLTWASGAYVLYINGVSVANGTYANGTTQSCANITIGAYNGAVCGGGGVKNYFTGSIDDARIYNRALSATEINKLYGLGATTHVAVSTQTGLSASTTPQGLSNGLVGWWTFDGKNMLTNVADSSGNGNAGRLIGFTSTSSAVTPGKLGQALTFDGVNDEVVLDNLPGLAMNGTNRFTVSAWVKPSNDTSARGVFSRGGFNTAAGQTVYALDAQTTSPTRWRGEISDGTTIITALGANNTVTPNMWQYLTLTWDGTTLTLYKNGASIATGSNVAFTTLWDGDEAADTRTSISANGRNDQFYFGGSIDDVRVYNRALSATEINKLYGLGNTSHVGVTPTTGLAATTTVNGAVKSGPVGWWTFDGKNLLQNAADSSGLGKTGRLIGFTSTSSSVTAGKLGQALKFDGTDDYVGSFTSLISPIGDRTICAWFKTSSTARQTLVSTRNSVGSGFSFTVNRTTSGNLTYFHTGGATFEVAAGITTNKWYYACVTLNGSTAQLYINGSSLGTQGGFTAETSPSANGTIGLEAYQSLYYFNGSLDDVRIYNRALSAAEVLRLYQTGQ